MEGQQAARRATEPGPAGPGTLLRPEDQDVNGSIAGAGQGAQACQVLCDGCLLLRGCLA